MKILLIFIAALLITQNRAADRVYFTLWQMNIEGDSSSYAVSTPSTLAQNLIQIKKISSDPYYRDNFLAFYNYETKGATYVTSFAAPASAQGPAVSQITFEGLDTHCDVYLNDKLILSAHNMFRTYTLNVTGLKGNNTLRVSFNSSAVYDKQKQKEFGQKYGFYLPQNYSFTRKAAYQYGWDWGPRILTVGIWKQCYIDFGTPLTFTNPIIKLTTPIKQKNPKIIKFNVMSQMKNIIPGTYRLTIMTEKDEETIYCQNRGLVSVTPPFKIDYPCTINTTNSKNVSKYVWWTWDLGQPNLFLLTVSIQSQDGSRKYTKTVNTGFKTVTIKQEKDAFGSSFTLNLNGYDVFIRGGNYIPPEMSMSNLPASTYQKIKQYALFGRYNMIRLWGGGQFEHDQFYKTMDEAGILVWHDLMFACALYPVTEDGGQAENIQREMEDNLYRVGYHPSIGIWNGNNQVWIGWQQWGWKDKLKPSQIQTAQKMYHKIFSQVLPSVITRITPDIFYWQTSPSSSSNQPSTIGSGDIHFWRVWGGGTPIEEYETYVGRFNSEYGMQSMPEYSSIIKFTAPSDRTIGSLILRLHQRHIYGDKYLPMYTTHYAGTTPILKRYAYYTQVMQAYALELAIVSLRGSKPYCMGSIYWQLNDVWPVSSWATVDYEGQYKIAHYRVRQLHEQLLLHVVHVPKSNSTEEFWKVVAVNQYDKKVSFFVMVRVMDFNGTVLRSYQIEKTVSQFENLVLTRLNITGDINKNRTLVNVNGRTPESGQIFNNNYFFVPPANRTKLDPKLLITKLSQTKLKIKATASVANYIWIRAKNEVEGYNLPNNYFDLLAGEEIVVETQTSADGFEVSCYQCEILKDVHERESEKEKESQKITATQ